MWNEFFVVGISLIGLVFSAVLAWNVKRADQGPEEVKTISSYIREGAIAFLKKEYQVVVVFAIIIAVILAAFLDSRIALSFVFGALFSAISGNIGMRIATAANGRTAWAVKEDIGKGLRIAFSSGTVMGLSVVSLGLLGVSGLYIIFGDPQVIYGFGFGASLIALFARVGGGIYTKAADVGADLVGKVEAGIPEDDPRNPAVIADNVGDNVGDVAGMGADLFESYVDSVIAAMVLGTTTIALGGNLVVFPLFIAALGIIASILGSIFASFLKNTKPHLVLNFGIWSAAILSLIGSFFGAKYLLHDVNVFYAIASGLIAGIIIGIVTEYYTSARFSPTKKVSAAAETGAGTNIIEGLGLGMMSIGIPVLIVGITMLISYKVNGVYGVAMAAVGMLSTLGITLATDTYGPVADNAAGIAEMAHLGKETRERAEELDSVGNTTAAIGKGFAIGSAALTAVVLGISYAQIAGLQGINMIDIRVFIGVLIGGFLPYMFSSFSMSAVGRAAFGIVNEVRRQWKEIPGLAEGNAKPDYAQCVAISTKSALREMIAPGIIAILAPVLVGLLLGKEALGGFLLGSVVSGFMLAVLMANAGGSWDNAKKYIEGGNFGGKGSAAHKAAVVGDTVGDPFKDTAGPSLNILIKLMSIIALLLVPFMF